MAGKEVMLLIVSIFMFIGILFIGISIGFSRRIRRRKKACTQSVNAKVVDMECIKNMSTESDRPNCMWYPVYEYWAGNRSCRVRSHVGGGKNAFRIGQTVTLLVDPEIPTEFYNPSDSMNILQKIFLMAGVVSVFAGIGIGIAGLYFIC